MMRVVALRVTVVAVVSAVLLGIAANPASADWYFADGLEAATTANWAVGGSGAGNSSRVYTTDCGLARSGCGGVVITQTGPGFMSAGRPLHIGAPQADWCWLSGYLQRRIYGNNVLRINVEVIDPKTWTYLAAQTVTLHGPGSGIWDQGSAFFVLGTVRDVFIRFSVLGDSSGSTNMVNIDDVGLFCLTMLA